jgi:hypothetical protein
MCPCAGHKGVCRDGVTVPLILNCDTVAVSVSVSRPASLPSDCGWGQRRSERFGEEKHMLLVSGIERYGKVKKLTKSA